jgi:hypothetical protein
MFYAVKERSSSYHGFHNQLITKTPLETLGFPIIHPQKNL